MGAATKWWACPLPSVTAMILVVVLPCVFGYRNNTKILGQNFRFQDASKMVAGELSFNSSTQLLLHDLRYTFDEPAQWWGVSANSGDGVLSVAELDITLDGTPLVLLEVAGSVDLDSLEALELRTVSEGSVLAHVSLVDETSDMVAPKRKLLQACSSKCRFTFKKQAKTYCYCSNVNPGQGGLGLAVYWSQTNVAGNTRSISVAIQGTANSQVKWAAIGFPSIPGQMVGSNAVVIQTAPTTTGASAGQYSLVTQAYDGSGVRRANNLVITGLEAELSNGLVKARFMVYGKKNVDLSKALLDIVWAQGPLTTNGKLAFHYQWGKSTLKLVQAPRPG